MWSLQPYICSEVDFSFKFPSIHSMHFFFLDAYHILDTVLGARALVDAGGVILILHQSGSKTMRKFL